MACYQLLPEFEKQRAALIEQAKSSGVWKDIKSVQLSPNLFSQAAISGADWISPRETLNLFRDYQDQLTELWEGK